MVRPVNPSHKGQPISHNLKQNRDETTKATGKGGIISNQALKYEKVADVYSKAKTLKKSHTVTRSHKVPTAVISAAAILHTHSSSFKR